MFEVYLIDLHGYTITLQYPCRPHDALSYDIDFAICAEAIRLVNIIAFNT